MKLSTLCFLLKGDQILLAMKKRGFGEGKWNGAGGKVNPDESIEHAALRELEEEVGVKASEKDLKRMGVLHFRSKAEPLNWDCDLFFLERWKGEPSESEEMRPQWFSVDQLPFDLMWPDDRIWFPYVLARKKIEAMFELDETGKTILTYSIAELQGAD